MTMNELARFAAGEHMIPKAPVQATRSIQITAPLDEVWSILTGVPDWELWHPYLENATLAGAFSTDTQLTYGGFIKHKFRIAKVVPGKLASFTAQSRAIKGKPGGQ